MIRVLITGATGFIGGWCARRAQGMEIHAVSRMRCKLPNVQSHIANLLNEEAMLQVIQSVRPTHLLHAAWETQHGSYWNAPENEAWHTASVRLAEAFYDAGGKRFLGIGSCAEYAWGETPLCEPTTALTPATEYGIWKNRFRKQLESMGQSSAWARLFFVYGPGEPARRILPTMIEKLQGGGTVPCIHGRQVRDFLYAQDAADAILTLLKSDVRGAMNIASGQPRTIRNAIEAIAQVSPGIPDFGRIPSNDETPSIVACVDRLTREFGFRPAIDFNEGITRTIACRKESHATDS